MVPYLAIETLQVVQIDPFKRSKWCLEHHLDAQSLRMVVSHTYENRPPRMRWPDHVWWALQDLNL